MSIIAVLGATGIQGGSVIQQLLKNSSWKIRAITRNPNGVPAQGLSAKGIEVVHGDLEDISSLVAAFEGATAIFAVTNFWDVPPMGPTALEDAGKREHRQIINVSRAASRIPTLKHFIVSSLPRPTDISDGKHKVPHMDYKSLAVEEVEKELPELGVKMTSLWVGWYATNLALWPAMKPFLWPALGKYLWVNPSKPDGKLPSAGDVRQNIGVVVERILERPAQTLGKIVPLVTEYPTMTEVVQIWEKVTGRPAAYAELTNEAAVALMGPLATEFGAQLRFSEDHPDWSAFKPQRTVDLRDLGLAEGLVGVEGTLRGFPAESL